MVGPEYFDDDQQQIVDDLNYRMEMEMEMGQNQQDMQQAHYQHDEEVMYPEMSPEEYDPED